MILEYFCNHGPALAGAVALGTVVGMLTGYFGAGGGFIITPALNIFLGLDMNLAVGTSACQVLGASSFSLWHHFDRRMPGIRVALAIGVGIPAGTYFGAQLVEKLKALAPWRIHGAAVPPVNFALLAVLAVFLFAIGGWMLYDAFVRRRGGAAECTCGVLCRMKIPPNFRFRTIPSGPFSIPVLVALGAAMGFLGGLLGIGGGVVMLPALIYLVGQDIKAATRTTTLLIFVSGLFSTYFHATHRNIDYPVAAALVFGAFFGARWGAVLHRRAADAEICRYFAFVVLAAWLLVVWKLAEFFR
jgi:hypothetical protein